MSRLRHFGPGARAAVPLAVAVGVFGVSFGVLAQKAGMGVLAPIVMSITAFAGSAQFAAVSLLSTGAGVAAASIAAILLNLRYLPIGVSAASALQGGRLKRLLEAQLVVDESWALGQPDPGRFDRHLMIGAGLLIYAAWVIGTTIGVLAGDLLGDPKNLGLDAAFPALFLALLAGQLRSRRAVVGALAGAAIALALVPVSRPGVPLIAACAGCLIGVRRR
ncbi:MAG: AzlC family ABC transporter permease [Thermoleophilaceae bacterium]